MQSWHSTYLGRKDLPRELSSVKLQTFFTFCRTEREVIDARYGVTHRVGLALHIGFLRLSGRTLNAIQVVPTSLWAYLGKELGVKAPELASLKTMYGRAKTLFAHQAIARETLGFRAISDHQARAFVRALREEAPQCGDKGPLMAFARRWVCEHKFLIEHDRAPAKPDRGGRESARARNLPRDQRCGSL